MLFADRTRFIIFKTPIQSYYKLHYWCTALIWKIVKMPIADWLPYLPPLFINNGFGQMHQYYLWPNYIKILFVFYFKLTKKLVFHSTRFCLVENIFRFGKDNFGWVSVLWGAWFEGNKWCMILAAINLYVK